MVYLRVKRSKPYKVICFNEKGRLNKKELIDQLQDIKNCINIQKIVSTCICKDYQIPIKTEGVKNIEEIIKILEGISDTTYFVKCEIAYLEEVV